MKNKAKNTNKLNKEKLRWLNISKYTCVILALCFTVPAMAAGEISSELFHYAILIRNAGYAIAAVSIAIGAFQVFTSSNSTSALDKLKERIARVLLAVFALSALPWALNWGVSTFSLGEWHPGDEGTEIVENFGGRK